MQSVNIFRVDEITCQIVISPSFINLEALYVTAAWERYGYYKL